MNLGALLKLQIARAVVKLVNDAGGLQTIQASLLADEVKDDAEHFQHYGFTSVPLAGAEALAFSVGGNRGHLVIHGVDDRRNRLKGLLPGEVAIYTDQGDKIVLKRDGHIEVTASTEVKVTAPVVKIIGDLQVQGSISATGQVSDVNGSMQEMRGVYNGHTHPETGATTSAPNQAMT